MNAAPRLPPSLLVLLTCCPYVVGCGEAEGVTGTVTLDGEPLRPQPPRVVRVALLPVAGDPAADTPSAADVRPDGGFALPELPPGDYRAVVHDFDRYPFRDRLAAHFRGRPDSLPVTVEPGRPVTLAVDSAWYDAAPAAGSSGTP